MIAAASLIKVVEESRNRADILLENEHPFVLQDVGNLTFRIEHIAKLTRACRTYFQACRHETLPRSVQAESAFLDDALGTRTVREIRHIRVQVARIVFAFLIP